MLKKKIKIKEENEHTLGHFEMAHASNRHYQLDITIAY